MRRPPPLVEFPRFPVVGGTAALAVGLTLAWHAKGLDVSALLCDPRVGHGQPWRLLTSALLHVNYLHLFFNVYWIWVFGSFVEETFGHVRAFGLMALFAAGSAGADYAFSGGGVGLSGVGYGLFGMLWVLARNDRRYVDVIDQNTAWLFVMWFFACIATTVLGWLAVANVAHGAGALLGVGVGWAIARPRWRFATAAATGVLATAFVAAAVFFRPQLNLSSDRGADEDRLALADLEAGDAVGAESWSRRAVAMNPAEPRFWHNLGVALGRQDRTSEMTAALEETKRLRGGKPFDEPSH